jgi:hypothetical protein
VVAAASRIRRGGLAFALVACTLIARAAAPPWVVDGGCRDGAPHGAWALRAADGPLRAAGAFSRDLRTGGFLFWSSRSPRIAQLPFDGDTLDGTMALWYLPKDANGDPPPKLEAMYARGRRHGDTRSWYPNGRLRAEFRYDRGQVVDARAYGPSGTPLPAARDLAADTEYLSMLEALVRDHPPGCASRGRSP